jgi:lipopolysaccharide transport system ATP-binding protein
MAGQDQDGARPVAVSATGLSKHYNLGELHSLQRTVRRVLRRDSPGAAPGLEALRDVDLTVWQGEAFAVVGTNGSGKSTLLQLLAGTTLPTRGIMRVYGRVLPLLAVNLGFHPELTGRENVMLFGSSLRIPRRTIASRMERVTAFAELERHMDTPVKRFSSGMMSRLSVAIAVQFPADIYIFDEVLAVVDGEFQARCIAEIKGLHAQGRTVVFVSHHGAQVAEVAERAIWLERGSVRDEGPVGNVLDGYARVHGASAGIA